MIYSKLLEVPEFSPLPSSDAANVEENIVFWIEKEKQSSIDSFLRPDPSRPHGYRFVTDEDFTETKTVEQTISKVQLSITYTRKAHRTNICFYPLSFSVRSIDAVVHIGNESFSFKSDNHLKNKIKEYKNGIIIRGANQ